VSDSFNRVTYQGVKKKVRKRGHSSQNIYTHTSMHKIVSISSSVSAHYILAYNEAQDVKHVFVRSNSVMTKLWKMTCKQLPKVSVFT